MKKRCLGLIAFSLFALTVHCMAQDDMVRIPVTKDGNGLDGWFIHPDIYGVETPQKAPQQTTARQETAYTQQNNAEPVYQTKTVSQPVESGRTYRSTPRTYQTTRRVIRTSSGSACTASRTSACTKGPASTCSGTTTRTSTSTCSGTTTSTCPKTTVTADSGNTRTTGTRNYRTRTNSTQTADTTQKRTNAFAPRGTERKIDPFTNPGLSPREVEAREKRSTTFEVSR